MPREPTQTLQQSLQIAYDAMSQIQQQVAAGQAMAADAVLARRLRYAQAHINSAINILAFSLDAPSAVPQGYERITKQEPSHAAAIGRQACDQDL